MVERKRWRSGELKHEDDMPLAELLRRELQRREEACMSHLAAMCALGAHRGDHPNARRRNRTRLAGELVAHYPAEDLQIVALLVWRMHHTEEAMRDLLPSLRSFSDHGDLNKLR